MAAAHKIQIKQSWFYFNNLDVDGFMSVKPHEINDICKDVTAAWPTCSTENRISLITWA